jgi:ArsR family transcriptional regulator
MSQSVFEEVSRHFLNNGEACERVLRMVSLFSNEVRFKILCALNEGDFCVGEIAELVGGKHSNVSQQLKMLTLAGYLSRRRRERRIIYHLEDERVRRTVEFLRREFGG